MTSVAKKIDDGLVSSVRLVEIKPFYLRFDVFPFTILYLILFLIASQEDDDVTSSSGGIPNNGFHHASFHNMDDILNDDHINDMLQQMFGSMAMPMPGSQTQARSNPFSPFMNSFFNMPPHMSQNVKNNVSQGGHSQCCHHLYLKHESHHLDFYRNHASFGFSLQQGIVNEIPELCSRFHDQSKIFEINICGDDRCRFVNGFD